MMLPDQITNACSRWGIEVMIENNSTPITLKLQPDKLVSLCEHLLTDPDFFFDQLSCVTGIDNGVEAGTMEVIYHLNSIPHHLTLALKVVLPRSEPTIQSVSAIWKSADWLEREVFDMFGIQFMGHPDLRRILMPADWEGYPLRKDFKHAETYRDIKVAY